MQGQYIQPVQGFQSTYDAAQVCVCAQRFADLHHLHCSLHCPHEERVRAFCRSSMCVLAHVFSPLLGGLLRACLKKTDVAATMFGVFVQMVQSQYFTPGLYAHEAQPPSYVQQIPDGMPRGFQAMQPMPQQHMAMPLSLPQVPACHTLHGHEGEQLGCLV
jgi:hypothetical protein